MVETQQPATLQSYKTLWKSMRIMRFKWFQDLWTPVSYCLAERVKSRVTGSPAFPGMRTTFLAENLLVNFGEIRSVSGGFST
jgi:hypothetical protein